MAVTFEQAKTMIEALFLEDCPNCGSSGKISLNGKTLTCPDCKGGGKSLNGLGDALIEFLGDWLTKFAEADHSHTVR